LQNRSAAIRGLAWIIFGSSIVGFSVGPAAAFILRFVSPYSSNTASGFAYSALFLLICVGALFFGASFPLVAHASIGLKSRTGAAVSYIYAANIAGSTVGALLVGFILMNYFSPFVISLLLLIAGISFSTAALGRCRAQSLFAQRT